MRAESLEVMIEEIAIRRSEEAEGAEKSYRRDRGGAEVRSPPRPPPLRDLRNWLFSAFPASSVSPGVKSVQVATKKRDPIEWQFQFDELALGDPDLHRSGRITHDEQ